MFMDLPALISAQRQLETRWLGWEFKTQTRVLYFLAFFGAETPQGPSKTVPRRAKPLQDRFWIDLGPILMPFGIDLAEFCSRPRLWAAKRQ